MRIPTPEDVHTAYLSGEEAVVHLIQNLSEDLLKIIKELQAQKAKDSGNSSKPPSSEGLGKKPRPERRSAGS